jgi:membrane protein
MSFHQGQFKTFVLVRTARRIHLPSLAELRHRARHSALVELLRRVWEECRIAEAMDMAAQVSFYFALSCFPFLLVLAALLGWIHRSENWYSFWYWMTTYLPTSAQDTVLTIMINLSKGFKGFLSFGLLLTMWSASTGFLSLMEALSHVYRTKDTRSYLKRRALALAATILGAGFLLACFGIWSAGHLVVALIFHYSVYFATQWKIVRWAITLAMILIGVDLINYFLPAKRPPWRWIMPGSAFTVICFVAASAILKLYVSHNHVMSRIYGALTGFIAIMLWIYLVNLSVLLGAQTDAVLLQMKSERG